MPALSLGRAGIQGRQSGSGGAWEFTTASLTHTGQIQNVCRTGASALMCHVPPRFTRQNTEYAPFRASTSPITVRRFPTMCVWPR